MIVFNDVSKSYGKKHALSHVSFRIEPGEFVCITGPGGAGKSTLLHLLIRLVDPTSGAIEVDGADLRRLPLPVLQLYRRRTGILFQDERLLQDRTVRENVALSPEATDATDEVIGKQVTAMLKRLGIGQIADAFPSELSGGEKRRTALARALVHKPSIVLVDEPTGNLDADQSGEILRLLREVNEEGATVILASQNRHVVDSLGVRMIRLEDGKVVTDAAGGHMQERTEEPEKRIREHEDVETANKHQSGGHVKPIGVQ
ncbi:MAG: ATP-binding cassette domain-containing protein [Candidatus Peribacteraceae bacterium]|nr:ATP-binding cassette domain-containing protein [Candidatus Peribacteraceae bacterium]